MSCSDSKKSKKRKSYRSVNPGDVLGKECKVGENVEITQNSCCEEIREEADGAPSGDEQLVPHKEHLKTVKMKLSEGVKENGCVDENSTPVSDKEEKPCLCKACKDRRAQAAEQLEEMRRLQAYWLELRQYIRMIYRISMNGIASNNDKYNIEKYNIENMKELVQKLCARDPHQLYQRLEGQVQEFVIEVKVRQLEVLQREQDTPDVAQIFISGLLEGYETLCSAAKQLSPLLQQLEIEHLQKFNLTWEVLNKHLYQSSFYTDPLVQNNLPRFISQLRNILPEKNKTYSELVHSYLAFDDEMTLVGAMWRDAEARIHAYNQEQATLKAKQRMLQEDWEFFKAQRKLIQQKMWNKTASELREFDEQLMNLASMTGPEEGLCIGCSSRRGCSCEECAMTHLLTCSAIITPPDSPGAVYGHKTEYRPEGEGSEQPAPSPAEPSCDGEAVQNSEPEPVDQQQSCECHVCTAPLMSPVDLMESYECHSCVQQGVPLIQSNSPSNLNLHSGGFHLYPHIHGTGGGGDTGSLYPHLYNIHPSLLSQLGSKHSRLGSHLPDQIQVNGVDTISQHTALPSTSDMSQTSHVEDSLIKVNSTPVHVPSGTDFPVPSSNWVKQSVQNSTKCQVPKSPVTSNIPLPKGTSAVCRDHVVAATGKILMQNLQSSSTSTQTSPNKAHQQEPQKMPAKPVPPNIRRSQSVPNGQTTTPTVNGHHHHHHAHNPRLPLGNSSVRHSTTQTANPGSGHNHQSLPDVVKSAATSSAHRSAVNGNAKPNPPHSCYKNLKSAGSVEQIKRVACAEYADNDIDGEESLSQDDTCSERSSATTTSTQRDPRHCDCCYCEVFGHGNSVAPVNRNYQEMRERLRYLLTKKRNRCKVNGKNSGTPSPDSLGNDPRDLEALLRFIEGNQSSAGKCQDAKKAAKKARQKQKKLEEKERKDQEEAERLRLEELQSKNPEVTITVVNTPGQQQNITVPSIKGKHAKKSEISSSTPGSSAKLAAPSVPQQAPQMVTIKRVMEPNSTEPTVTITLKGATPDKDKVLFTLVNGQVCASQESSKSQNQQASISSKNNQSNGAVNGGKKKKNKNGANSAQLSSQSATTQQSNKSQQQSKNKTKGASKPVNGVVINKQTPIQVKQSANNQSVPIHVQSSDIIPSGIQINNVLNSLSNMKTSQLISRIKPEGSVLNGTTQSFSLENLKLPPGITITKVDGPVNVPPRKPQTKPAEISTPTTIIATPTSGGAATRLSQYGSGMNGSNVIVVDTGRMKESVESNLDLDKNGHSIQVPSNNSKKKNKKKNKNGNQDVNGTNCNGSNPNGGNKQRQTQGNGANSKQQLQNHTKNTASNNVKFQNLGFPEKCQIPPSVQPAIIKVNGSMVTIRNPALHQAVIANARSAPQVNGRADSHINGDVSGKTGGKNNKKVNNSVQVVNNGPTGKGKENTNVKLVNGDNGCNKNKKIAQSECNGVHNGKLSRNEGKGNNSNTSAIRPLQSNQSDCRKNVQCHEPSNRTSSHIQGSVQEAVATNEAKKKKKKKKNSNGQGHADDWNLVESVFAPKDIDLENGDIDDDERELEAFKRFCFNSIPPQRKEKVHLNIKDIVLKKKAAAIGCS